MGKARLAWGCPVLLSDRRGLAILVATSCMDRPCMPLISLYRGYERLAGERRLSFYLSIFFSLHRGFIGINWLLRPIFTGGRLPM